MKQAHEFLRDFSRRLAEEQLCHDSHIEFQVTDIMKLNMAATALDDAQADIERVNYLERWRERGLAKGFGWNAHTFHMDLSIRDQLDADNATSNDA